MVRVIQLGQACLAIVYLVFVLQDCHGLSPRLAQSRRELRYPNSTVLSTTESSGNSFNIARPISVSSNEPPTKTEFYISKINAGEKETLVSWRRSERSHNTVVRSNSQKTLTNKHLKTHDKEEVDDATQQNRNQHNIRHVDKFVDTKHVFYDQRSSESREPVNKGGFPDQGSSETREPFNERTFLQQTSSDSREPFIIGAFPDQRSSESREPLNERGPPKQRSSQTKGSSSKGGYLNKRSSETFDGESRPSVQSNSLHLTGENDNNIADFHPGLGVPGYAGCHPTRPDRQDSYSCHGDNITEVPQDLPENINKLLMSSSPMAVVAKEAFIRYAQLTDIELRNFTQLTRIESGAFSGLVELKILIIIDCRSLKAIGPGVFGLFQNLDILRITKTGLTSAPDFSHFETRSKAQNNSMFEIDLSANKIRHIRARQFSGVKTYELRVQNNLLSSIEDRAFDGAVITRLLCKNNFNLRHLGKLAFSGIQEFHYLDLSRSKITELPTEGLINIRQLVVEETPSLKKFPSVFKFSEINVAKLTYEHHCCAFRHAAKQDPAESSNSEQTAVSSACVAPVSQLPAIGISTAFLPTTIPPVAFRVKRSLETFHEVIASLVTNFAPIFGEPIGDKPLQTENLEVEDADEEDARMRSRSRPRFGSADGDFIQPTARTMHKPADNFGIIISGKSTKAPTITGRENDLPDGYSANGQVLGKPVKDGETHKSPTGSWHDKPQHANGTTKWVTCGNFSSPKDYSHVVCTPRPNAFNPCEDVMGYEWLRIFVWLVLLAALGGNLVVIVVLLSARSKLTVPKFLMCNLSFADFLMGLYLLLIASVDVHFLGEYFTHAVSWQNDGGCQVAGFLTVFSSELSVFVLTVITLERWYAISQAIHVNKRLRMRQATCLMFAGWVYASSLAVLPLLGVSGYGAVSICLPMEAKDPLDIVYIILLLVFNGIAFTAICGCYISMFLKVRASENMARSNDATIAKRMAILVLTNFICWAPIAFFGLTASFGFPLIDITNSKVLLVFFYPFNSCANPFLYAILTKQFRKDVFILLGRYGLCTDRANRYKGTSVTRSYSYNSRHNNGLMVGHHRHQPSASDVSILSQYCRAGSRGSRGSLFSQSGAGWGSSTPPRMSRTGSSKDSLSRSGLHRLSGSGTSSLLESSLDSYSMTNQGVPPNRNLKTTALSQSPSSSSPPACSRTFFPSNRSSSPTNTGSSNGSEGRSSKSERKLSTVLETSHASSEPLSDDGCGISGVLTGNGESKKSKFTEDQYVNKDVHEAVREERILQGRDSLRDLFEGQPHGRVRSASEYVVIFKPHETGSSGSAAIASSWEKNSRAVDASQSQRPSRTSEGQGCERRISRDTVLSNNTVSSLVSSNTMSSVTSQPFPGSSHTSDTEQHNSVDKKRTGSGALMRNLYSKPFFQLDSFETVGAPKRDNGPVETGVFVKNSERHANDIPSPFLYDEEMTLEQLTNSFLEFENDNSLSCQDKTPIFSLNQDERTAIGKVSFQNSHIISPYQKTNESFKTTPLNFNDKLNKESGDKLTSPNYGNISSINTRPSIETSGDRQQPRIGQKIPRDICGSMRITDISLQLDEDSKAEKVSAASERDGLLSQSSRTCHSHNGTFNTRTWPTGAIVEEDDDDEEDEDLEREARVRERRKRRKRRKKLKPNGSSYARVWSGPTEGLQAQADPDQDEDLDFLDSLLQAV